MASIQNMTQGRPGRLIFSFALPLMIGNLFQQFYTVADAMIVGRTLGLDALGSVGAAEWVVWLMLGIVQGAAQGFSIPMAQAFGAGEYRELRSVTVNSALLSAVISLLLVVSGHVFAGPVLTALKTPAAVYADATWYLRILFWGSPVTMAYNLLSSILRSLGDGKTPLRAMALAAATNILLDLVLILTTPLGVAGAAIATVAAQALAGVFCFLRVRQIDVLRLSREDLTLRGRTCLRLLALGTPPAFQNTVISVGGMIVQSVVNDYGVLFLAGFTATNKLYGMLEVAATSYGFSMTTYAGQNWGAGRPDRVRQGYRAALGIAMVTSLVITAVMVLGGRALLRCFITGEPQDVEAALAIAYHYLFIMSVCLPILYYLHVTQACVRGLGNTVLPMLSGVMEFAMRTGSALLLPLRFGQEGIFYAEVLAWAGADLVLFFSYLYCRYRMLRPAPDRS